ncbi:hypothetical protein YC2023_010848 [Brassica napus]
MAVDEENELPEATPREAELQRKLDGIQNQVTEINRARIEVAPNSCSEVQSLKEKLNEHSKQLEQIAEKLIQLEAQIRPMTTLETPNSGTGVNILPTTSQGDAATREKTNGAHTYDVEDIEYEPKPDKETPEEVAKTESPMVVYMEQMFSKRLDDMQSMVERLPGAYDGTSDPDDHVAQYRQRMLAVALPKESCEGTMSIASFAILSDKFMEQFASSRDVEKTSDGLYEILLHRAEPCEATLPASI